MITQVLKINSVGIPTMLLKKKRSPLQAFAWREAGRQGGREAGRQGGREAGRQGGREVGR